MTDVKRTAYSYQPRRVVAPPPHQLCLIADAAGSHVATLNPETTCGQADELMRRLNAHDDLLAACKNALADIVALTKHVARVDDDSDGDTRIASYVRAYSREDPTHPLPPVLIQRITELEAAIAKARPPASENAPT